MGWGSSFSVKSLTKGLSDSASAAKKSVGQLTSGNFEGAGMTLAKDKYIASVVGALTANQSMAFTQGAGVSSGGLGGLNATGMSSPTGETAAGAAAGQSISKALAPVPLAPAEIPPDLLDMYKNDPEQAKQFMRLRKAASMLGRAGTIKAKGSETLGSTQPLGTNLALAGA